MSRYINKWCEELNELELFFEATQMPETPLSISKGETIFNAKLAIETNIKAARANSGTRVFLPYLERLREIKQYIEN